MVWLREEVVCILSLAAYATTRGKAANLTDDERVLLASVCAGFGVRLDEVLPPERQAAQGAGGDGDRET